MYAPLVIEQVQWLVHLIFNDFFYATNVFNEFHEILRKRFVVIFMNRPKNQKDNEPNIGQKKNKEEKLSKIV